MNLLTIVIPCFNEFESLPLLIKNLEKINNKINFLIVDNGSKDSSRNYLESIEEDLNKNISIFYIDLNQGYGNGVYKGLNNLKNSKFIGWVHGDLQFEFSKLNNVYEKLSLLENSKEKIIYKGTRKGRGYLDSFFSFSMGLIASLILGKRMYEINAQPTIFSNSLIDILDDPPLDFSFDTYVYWKALDNNYKLIRDSFLFPPRQYGESKWNFGLKTRLLFSYSLIKYFFKLRKG